MGVDVLGPWVVGGGALALTAAVVAPTPWDRRTLRAGAGLLVAACGMAVWALVSLDLRLELVAGHTTRSTAAPLRVAGLWGGSAGSLLLFSTLLAAVAAVGRREAVPRRSMAFAAAGFASITAVAVRPFERLPAPVLDGAGLVPVLRRGSMLIHPPVLYLGLVLLVVPLGLGVAQLREPAVDRQRPSCGRRQLPGPC